MESKHIEDVPFEEVYEIEKYGRYYSDSKLWKKVERIAKKVGATVIRPVLFYIICCRIKMSRLLIRLIS